VSESEVVAIFLIDREGTARNISESHKIVCRWEGGKRK
jgi:hypothetical protein